MVSPEFHINKWASIFPIAGAPTDFWKGARAVSASGIAFLEQARAATAAEFGDLGPTVPTDIFALACGEPRCRDVTKIGGLPYRPAGRPWPIARNGERMTFLAQFRFTDSHDIVGELPGDMLVMFIEGHAVCEDDPPATMAFEWYPLGLTDLATARNVPEPAWVFCTAYGVRYRTVDYANASPDAKSVRVGRQRPRNPCPDSRAQKAFKQIIVSNVGEMRERPLDFAASRLCAAYGIKIGGAPWWSHPELIGGENNRLPGRFLCSLSDVSAAIGPYPWVNQAKPVDLKARQRPEGEKLFLLFRDGSIMNFSIDDAGNVHRVLQFF